MEISFTKRIKKFGIRRLLISWDTLGFVIAFTSLAIYTNWSINFNPTGKDILDMFVTVSSTFFAIILTGLAIIASLTDKEYIKAWMKIGEFDNIVTTFQYDLIVTLVLLTIAFVLRFIFYDSGAMIFLISLFVYFILALIDLVMLISHYAILRGNLIEATDM